MSLLKLISEVDVKCDLFINILINKWCCLHDIVLCDSSFCNKEERHDFFLPKLSCPVDISKPDHHRSFTVFRIDTNKTYETLVEGGIYVQYPIKGHIYKLTSHFFTDMLDWIVKRGIDVTSLTFIGNDYSYYPEFFVGSLVFGKVTSLSLEGEVHDHTFHDPDPLMRQHCLASFLNVFTTLLKLEIKNTPSFTAYSVGLFEPYVLKSLSHLEFDYDKQGNANEVILRLLNHAHRLTTFICKDKMPTKFDLVRGTVDHTTIDLILQLNPCLVKLHVDFVHVTAEVLNCIKVQGVHLEIVEICGDNYDLSDDLPVIQFVRYLTHRSDKLKLFSFLVKHRCWLQMELTKGTVDMLSRNNVRKIKGKELLMFFEILAYGVFPAERYIPIPDNVWGLLGA
jgi:hypothetical protein